MRGNLILTLGILLVLSTCLVGSALAASLLVEVKPNPGTAGQPVTLTIIASDEGIKYLYGPCDLSVDWGDGTKPVNVGKLATAPGGILTKTATHTYAPLKGSTIVRTFAVLVSPTNCDASKNSANTVKTTVKIAPPTYVIAPR